LPPEHTIGTIYRRKPFKQNTTRNFICVIVNMKKINELLPLRFAPLLIILLLGTLTSCKEDDPSPGITNKANAKINNWILENMDFWYLWNDQLPASPDKNAAPEEFFESLLVDEDRFSWIQEDYQELLNSLQGINKEAGYEFVLYKESDGSENVIAQVVYIKPSSPAAQSGLKRGDVITQINEQQLTTANYQSLLAAIKENHTIRVKPVVIGEQRFESEKTISLTTLQYAENPNHMYKVIPAMDNKKIGYYVYNLFASGTEANTKVYDTEMEQIFADFKAQQITDLVLDLRFNSGGSEGAATNLASHIGKGIDNTKVFARRAYNPGVEKAIKDDPNLGASFLITRFSNKVSNIGNMLNGGRVYILTSKRTASASELIINSLKPFMDVFLIGDVTYGKNVGSISLYEEDDATNTWGLQPIVVKVYNSLDQSDYSNGFNPNVIHEDRNLYLYPLGDEREALLAQAIGQITGTATTGRVAPGKDDLEIIGHSLDTKRSSFNLVIDQNIPSFLFSH
jgi:carboxyl-terminal processing protease